MTGRGAAGCVCAALALTGCESTQTRSARLKANASSQAVEQGLQITRDNPDVRVEAATVLTDPRSKRSAAVITLHNTSGRLAAALPLVFELRDAGGQDVYTNASPGAAGDLVTVPSLAPGERLTWVNDAITGVAGARSVAARVGVPAQPATVPRAPRLRVGKVHLRTDPVDGLTAVGRVVNLSTVTQERLVIFAHATRGGRVVAAGRAIVPILKPGAKGATFTVFFVGNPRGAKLELQAPAVELEAAR